MAFGFGKKREEPQQKPVAAPGSPIQQIMAMRQRGMDNNQIIQEMERQGYNSSQIFEALNQINISGGNAGFDQSPQQMPPHQDFPYEQPNPYLQQQFDQFPQQPQHQEIDKDKIEEIAEAIIDEKWKEFEDDIKVVISWKDKTEKRVDQIEQQMKDLTESLESLHKSLIAKISDYDKNITDVGVEIKAMEKVFQKVLPSLTENVNKLERITKSSKSKK